jgi:hypothetical protein
MRYSEVDGVVGVSDRVELLVAVLNAEQNLGGVAFIRRRNLDGLETAPTVLALRLPSPGFSGPSIEVVPRNISSAWMGLPSGPFMMPRLEKPRVPARGLHADSANSAVSMADQESLLLSRCEVQ